MEHASNIKPTTRKYDADMTRSVVNLLTDHVKRLCSGNRTVLTILEMFLVILAVKVHINTEHN